MQLLQNCALCVRLLQRGFARDGQRDRSIQVTHRFVALALELQRLRAIVVR